MEKETLPSPEDIKRHENFVNIDEDKKISSHKKDSKCPCTNGYNLYSNNGKCNASIFDDAFVKSLEKETKKIIENNSLYENPELIKKEYVSSTELTKQGKRRLKRLLFSIKIYKIRKKVGLFFDSIIKRISDFYCRILKLFRRR
jgi:hypothetical protein